MKYAVKWYKSTNQSRIPVRLTAINPYAINRWIFFTSEWEWFGIMQCYAIKRFMPLTNIRLTDFVCIFPLVLVSKKFKSIHHVDISESVHFNILPNNFDYYFPEDPRLDPRPNLWILNLFAVYSAAEVVALSTELEDKLLNIISLSFEERHITLWYQEADLTSFCIHIVLPENFADLIDRGSQVKFSVKVGRWLKKVGKDQWFQVIFQKQASKFQKQAHKMGNLTEKQAKCALGKPNVHFIWISFRDILGFLVK